ncbi:ABC transporter permease [Clostridium taeniosporum]|uniref:ABC transporter permease n=1 Tax=Clostridium taeniosporum TaxID=394958 RepID=A0A1D7XMC6_9CLOT|nr:ABC transporter permease [Clostridium taeniosporum]AOR24482.1 ABC transporter permease [Clostridium taeniosporum]
MLAIFYNNWRRILAEKAYLIVAIMLTICAVTVAIILTNKIEVKGNIAVVSTDSNIEFMNCKYFNITKLDSELPKSELVQDRYDAVVKIKDGSYSIDTIKSDEFKAMLDDALEHPDTFVPNIDKSRRIGTNIIGYMMMFLLMQGVLYARFFAEDKEKHMIERVVMSPIYFVKYLLGHSFFIISMISAPSFIIIVVAKIVGVSIGFSLLQYAGLIVILGILSTTFALFLNSLFCVADTANMIGTSIIVLSSILAGSFYSFARKQILFNKLLNIIPQKDFINFVDALEKGVVSKNTQLQLIYVIGFSVILFIFAIVKTRKDYIYHE